MPVTMPLDDTVTTRVSLDCQLAWEVMFCVLPLDSDAVAVNCDVPPIEDGADPVTVTLVTLGVTGGAVTVMCRVPATLWKVARMSASPAATELTSPALLTVATAVLDDAHVA